MTELVTSRQYEQQDAKVISRAVFNNPLVCAGIGAQAWLDKEKPFHGSAHAIDVTQSCIAFSLEALPSELEEMLSSNQKLSCQLTDNWPSDYKNKLGLTEEDVMAVLHSDAGLIRDGKLIFDAIALLAITAAGHDNGFIRTPGHVSSGHELESAEILRERLERNGYPQIDIQRAMLTVLSTRLAPKDGVLSQTLPVGLLARLLQDADVANFGRRDFFEQSSRVFAERPNPLQTKEEFDASILTSLLEPHHWATPIAERLLGWQKRANVEKLAKRVQA